MNDIEYKLDYLCKYILSGRHQEAFAKREKILSEFDKLKKENEELKYKTKKGPNPFCHYCKETDCLIATGEPCEMVRKYLKHEKEVEELVKILKLVQACRIVAKHPEDNKSFWDTERLIEKTLKKHEKGD